MDNLKNDGEVKYALIIFGLGMFFGILIMFIGLSFEVIKHNPKGNTELSVVGEITEVKKPISQNIIDDYKNDTTINNCCLASKYQISENSVRILINFYKNDSTIFIGE